MSDADRIQQLLARSPGLKAQQIANELGIERSQVLVTLHGLMESALVQDSSYRWWPKARGLRDSNGNAASPENQPRTFLASLCRYYLECLARESGSGISLPAAEPAGYVALDRLPFASQAEEPWGADRAIRKIVQKTRRERGQLTLYVGYPVRLRSLMLRNAEELRIEPLLLYPIEDSPEERAFPLRPASGDSALQSRSPQEPAFRG